MSLFPPLRRLRVYTLPAEKNKKWKGDESLIDPSPFCAVKPRAIGKPALSPGRPRRVDTIRRRMKPWKLVRGAITGLNAFRRI